MTPVPARRQFLTIAAATFALFLGCELVLDLTAWGQNWDDTALLEARLLPEVVWDTCDTLLRIIRIPSILVAFTVCLAVAATRRQLFTGLVAVTVTSAAIVSAEVVKHLTPRPDLALELTLMVDNGAANTFPSGHATIVTALGLSLILVAAPRWRPWIASVAFACISLVACSTVIADWHRPSDAIGGMALATTWMALAGWFLSRLRGTSVLEHGAIGPRIFAFAWAITAFAALLALSLATAEGIFLALATAEIAILLIAGVLVASYARALKDVDFIR